MNIIPFQSQGFSIRAVEIDGEAWFVGKDIAEALGYTNPSKAMSDHCKGVTKRYPLKTDGGLQEMRLINEPDLFRLIVNCQLPAAEQFEQWVFEEVLPTIRKTGGYHIKRRAPSDEFARALKLTPLAIKAALATGCNPNAAIIHANQAIRKETGKDVLALLERTHLEAENQESPHYNPTELGEFIGLTSRQVNQALLAAGLQIKQGKKWIPTEKGRPHAFIADVGKAHGSGASIQQTRWYDSVLPIIEAIINQQEAA